MPVSHTNRKGQVYYLHEGKTKTGKPCYYFSKEQGDVGTMIWHAAVDRYQTWVW
jgi:hypothetical protein